ncbi:MAG: hypothetical protein EA352_07950 [Gemmatimonadales bacterium]|nr:MAG: hypothetical protein EA352_07950 [Gemmatimonadales bacterium]
MIRIVRADPLELDAGALVVAVGEDLDGITPAARRATLAAGPELLARLARLRGLPAGAAILVPGGGSGFDFLIPVVLLARDEPSGPALLERAATNVLRRAAEWDVESLVVPPLGLGAGQMDGEEAARVLMRVLAGAALPLRDIVVPASSDWEVSVLEAALAEVRA